MNESLNEENGRKFSSLVRDRKYCCENSRSVSLVPNKKEITQFKKVEGWEHEDF